MNDSPVSQNPRQQLLEQARAALAAEDWPQLEQDVSRLLEAASDHPELLDLLGHALLMQAMSALNDREKDVLEKRRLAETPITLEELSESYGVSRERIRQIEVRAFEKLQARMRELAVSKGMVVPA